MGLMDGRTTTGASTGVKSEWITSVQVAGRTTAGAGAATVNIEVSNDNVNWLVAFTVTLVLGTTPTSDGQALIARWEWVRANVTALSGTGATIDVIAGDGSTN